MSVAYDSQIFQCFLNSNVEILLNFFFFSFCLTIFQLLDSQIQTAVRKFLLLERTSGVKLGILFSTIQVHIYVYHIHMLSEKGKWLFIYQVFRAQISNFLLLPKFNGLMGLHGVAYVNKKLEYVRTETT